MYSKYFDEFDDSDILATRQT